MKTLDDLDPMPFGKYKGVEMQDVPARYLHWLWIEKDFKSQTNAEPVAEYIQRTLSSLKLEHSDGIW